jgi:hypothetical protein
MVDGDRRIYLSRKRRWLIATSLIALLLAGSSLIFERDPDTGLLPVPSDYLWVVIPGAILIAVLAWRALKVEVVTDRRGLEIVRVVGKERIPWSRLRRFEVHPTPGHQGSVVLARMNDEILVKVSAEVMVRPIRDRDEARRLAKIRTDELASNLEEDRLMRQAALAGVTAARTASSPTAPTDAGPASAGPTNAGPTNAGRTDAGPSNTFPGDSTGSAPLTPPARRPAPPPESGSASTGAGD